MFFKRLKLITTEEYRSMNELIDDLTLTNQKLQAKIHDLEETQSFFEKLNEKMLFTNARIIFTENNKDGVKSYVCMIDKRKPVLRGEYCYMNGEVDFFVSSVEINFPNRPGNITCMPYMYTTFCENKVVIDELHTDSSGGYYENKGYGAMMVNALLQIARDSGRSSIEGTLSFVDAETDEKKEKRNGFYEHMKFTVRYDDESHKNGHISMNIQNKNI